MRRDRHHRHEQRWLLALVLFAVVPGLVPAAESEKHQESGKPAVGGSGEVGRPAPSATLDRERPPSILLIVSDDQGYHDLGCFGGTNVSVALCRWDNAR